MTHFQYRKYNFSCTQKLSACEVQVAVYIKFFASEIKEQVVGDSENPNNKIPLLPQFYMN